MTQQLTVKTHTMMEESNTTIEELNNIIIDDYDTSQLIVIQLMIMDGEDKISRMHNLFLFVNRILLVCIFYLRCVVCCDY